jgi:hypothetical protein
MSSPPATCAPTLPVEVHRKLNLIAWAPSGDMDQPAWIKAGIRLGALSRSSNWWVGDWLRYGTAEWGAKYTAAAKITGYDPHSLENMVYVAGRFDISLRRENLSWSHHFLVAALEPDARSYWLDFATTHCLSVSDLRTELRAARRSASVTPDSDDILAGDRVAAHAICPQCGFQLPSREPRKRTASTRDGVTFHERQSSQ